MWALRMWVVVVSALLLGPALASGYLLTYDMVWVPDLALRPDFLGLGSGVPRAVPSDAVVSVLDEVIPGMLLQKLVLLGSLIAGGLGIQRWISPDKATVGSAAAATFYVWNPYVVERLAIGHWPMLVCAGVLPWLGLSLQRSVSERRLRPGLLLLLPLASLNASAGMAAGVVVAAFVFRREAGRRLALLASAVVAVANLPWVIAGLTKVGVIAGAAANTRIFAPAGEGSMPAALTSLTLGGIWNTEVVPTSRTTVLVWVSLAVLLVTLAPSWPRLRRGDVRPWWVCAAVGIGLAVLGGLAPGAIDSLADHVPGTGVLRDASRLLVLAVPLVAMAFGFAVDRWVRATGEAAPVIGLTCLIVPLAILPDAAWGRFGDLQAVSYPSSYAEMRQAVAKNHRDGDVLVLPFTSYRAPEWNGYRKVFDPVGRYLTPDYLASDALAVSGQQLPAEDPRGRKVLAILAMATPQERAEALAELGIGTVVTDLSLAEIPGQAPYVAEVAGGDVSTPGFRIETLTGAAKAQVSTPVRFAMGAAWLSYALMIAAGVWLGLAQRVRRKLP